MNDKIEKSNPALALALYDAVLLDIQFEKNGISYAFANSRYKHDEVLFSYKVLCSEFDIEGTAPLTDVFLLADHAILKISEAAEIGLPDDIYNSLHDALTKNGMVEVIHSS